MALVLLRPMPQSEAWPRPGEAVADRDKDCDCRRTCADQVVRP